MSQSQRFSLKLFSAGLREQAARRPRENKLPSGPGGYSLSWPIRGAPPERGTFFRLQLYERVGILLVEVYERVGKSVIWFCERVSCAAGAKKGRGRGREKPKGRTDEFYGFIKSGKHSIFVTKSYLNDNTLI